MHVRLSSTTRDGKTYTYAQLVESFRRPTDGLPAVRVIASLGALSPLELDNLRSALAASRAGKRVLVAPVARAAPVPDVLANLRYLDLAVALELWREWGLPDLLAGLLPTRDADVPPTAIVTALVLQRLVEPASKLAATEWFPRSALPELLDVPPGRFNNTRVHRVLDALDSVGTELMAKLPRLYQEKEGAFVSLFLDVSDAAFVGRGPSFAQAAKTKEGFVARKIGIVLLCNQRGLPVRWQVVPGAAHDSKTMLALLESISDLSWVREAPVVCDRAMGKTATITALLRLKLRFLTALTTTEFDTYSTDRVPFHVLAGLTPSTSSDAQVEAEAVRRVLQAGLEQVDDNLFVMDLGIVVRPTEGSSGVTAQAAPPAQALQLCRRMLELVAGKDCPSFARAGLQLGLGRGVAAKYRGLQTLAEDIQQDVLAGRADGCSLDELLRLARLDPEEQRRQFKQKTATPGHIRRAPRRSAAGASPEPAGSAVSVRVVAYFNQERFVEKRHRAQVELAEIRAFVDDLNERLVRSGSRRSRASIEAEVDRKLRAYDLVEAFTLTLHEESQDGRTRRRVELALDELAWERRRRHDGFCLLAAHPDLPHTAAALCRLYRAKDVVEKDFHVIKSVVEVRPVRHHDDDKVRAHVTLCMLALLLERTLGHRLRGKCTAEDALARLEPCRLNHFEGASRAYGLTRPTADQKDLLRHLGMTKLADDEAVAEQLHPR